jgi:hypothetical protein
MLFFAAKIGIGLISGFWFSFAWVLVDFIDFPTRSVNPADSPPEVEPGVVSNLGRATTPAIRYDPANQAVVSGVSVVASLHPLTRKR